MPSGEAVVASPTFANALDAYDPFGASRVTNQVDLSAPVNPLGFVGQYVDPASGLLDLRARQYDSATGRFTSLDPMPSSATTPYESSFGYVDNNPINNSDLSGQCTPRKCLKKLKNSVKKKAKSVASAVSSPFVAAIDEAKAQAAGAQASVVTGSMGGSAPAAKGPISGPASSPLQRPGMACLAELTGLSMTFTAAPIEAFEAREALRAGGGFAKSILRPGIGRLFGAGAVGLIGGGQAAGGCTG